MMLKCTEQPVVFSAKHLQARWLRNLEQLRIDKATIVINLGQEKAQLALEQPKQLPPMNSVLLKDVAVKHADSLLLIEIVDETNIGGIVLDPLWHQLGHLIDYPKDVPLWKSPQHDLGIISFDPYFATGMTDHPDSIKIRKHQVKVNLWFAPAKTNCAIHNQHEFLEVHTQIYGTGRMQKFHHDDFDTLCQEVIMSPGSTHIPFANVGAEGQFVYPWHQYYADTDCIWLANEFHPLN
jgi:hypothetical protein